MVTIQARQLELVREAASSIPTDLRSRILPKLLRSSGSRDRATLAASLNRFIKTNKQIQDEDIRIGSLRCLLCLMPDSLIYLQRLMVPSSNRLFGEIQFSLFCCMCDLKYIRITHRELLYLIDGTAIFLMSAKRDVAFAVWMAGNLLGSHLDHRYTTPALMNVLRKARFPEGRRAALAGLSECYVRTNQRMKSEIMSAIESCNVTDRSKAIRLRAGNVKNCLSTLRKREAKGK